MTVESLRTLTAAEVAAGVWISSFEAERVTGYSRETLKRLFYEGRLEAARYPKTSGGTNYRWYFKREQLSVKAEPKNRGKAKSSKPKESYELQQANIMQLEGKLRQLEGKLMSLKAIRDRDYPGAAATIDRGFAGCLPQSVPIDDIPNYLKLEDVDRYIMDLNPKTQEWVKPDSGNHNYIVEVDGRKVGVVSGQEILLRDRLPNENGEIVWQKVWFVRVVAATKQIGFCYTLADYKKQPRSIETLKDDSKVFALPKESAT